MNALALSGNGGALTTGGDLNFFEEIAKEVGRRSIVGDIIKFSKFGEYTAGQNNKEIKEGTALVANMDNLLMGWVRWSGQKPVDQDMAQVARGEKPKKRGELGYTDQSLWEVDATGRAQDPWQNTYYLLLKATDGSGDLYTFATASNGGRSAIHDLCAKFGAGSRMRPDEYPIIQLRVDSYKHDKFGKIHVPQLVIVGWSPKAEFEGEVAEVAAAPSLNPPAYTPGSDPTLSASQQLRPASGDRAPRGSETYAGSATAPKF